MRALLVALLAAAAAFPAGRALAAAAASLAASGLAAGLDSPDDRWTVAPAQAFPGFWFGANVTGPDAPHLRANGVLNYSAAWFGWQTLDGVDGCSHEETKLHSQAAAVKAAAPHMTTLAYGGDVSNVMTFYDKMKAALADKQNSGWFLPVHKTHTTYEQERLRLRAEVRGGGTCGFSGNPAWDFRNASARAYFAEVVIGQWATDPSVDAVFVDEADAIVCTWGGAQGRDNGLPTLTDVYAWSNGSVLAYRQAAAILAAQGKRLVVSLKNGYAGSAPVNAKIGRLCPVQMDAIAEGMSGVPWIRFHEYFAALSPTKTPPATPTRPHKANATTMCHNTIRTAMREAANPDMAFAVHSGDYQGGVSNLNLSFAIFMMARNGTIGAARDWFSWSSGASPGDFWTTAAWHWQDTAALYTREWGLPLRAAATLSGGAVWRREYEHATITVDCATLKPTFELLSTQQAAAAAAVAAMAAAAAAEGGGGRVASLAHGPPQPLVINLPVGSSAATIRAALATACEALGKGATDDATLLFAAGEHTIDLSSSSSSPSSSPSPPLSPSPPAPTPALLDATGCGGGRLTIAGVGMDETRLTLTTHGGDVLFGRSGWTSISVRDITFARPTNTTTQGRVVATDATSLTLQMNDGLGGGDSDGIVFPTMGALFADLPAGSDTGMYLKRFRVQTQGHSPKGHSRTPKGHARIPLEQSGQSTGQTWRPPQIITHLGLNASGPWPPVENNQESFPCGGKGCPDVQELVAPNSTSGVSVWRVRMSWGKGGEQQRYAASIGDGTTVVGVKVKNGGREGQAYFLRGGECLSFERVRWTQHSRGVVHGTPHVLIRDTRVEHGDGARAFALSTPGGGPQINGALNLTIVNHTSVGTGDDALGLFDVQGGSVVGCHIRDSFARGILLNNCSDAFVANVRENVVLRCPVLRK